MLQIAVIILFQISLKISSLCSILFFYTYDFIIILQVHKLPNILNTAHKIFLTLYSIDIAISIFITSFESLIFTASSTVTIYTRGRDEPILLFFSPTLLSGNTFYSITGYMHVSQSCVLAWKCNHKGKRDTGPQPFSRNKVVK